jgi:hypothetical protein
LRKADSDCDPDTDSERTWDMAFSHEKLDVYRAAIEYTRWAFSISRGMSGTHRHARDQLLRASQSIPLNIAEGNGKAMEGDRRHFLK